MRYLWGAGARSRHVTFRPKARCSALRFSGPAPAATGGSFVESESRGCLDCRLVFSALWGTTAFHRAGHYRGVAPQLTSQRHPLARMLHLTTAYTTCDGYIPPLPQAASTNRLIFCRAPSKICSRLSISTVSAWCLGRMPDKENVPPAGCRIYCLLVQLAIRQPFLG